MVVSEIVEGRDGQQNPKRTARTPIMPQKWLREQKMSPLGSVTSGCTPRGLLWPRSRIWLDENMPLVQE
jgi:hypothetical protein